MGRSHRFSSRGTAIRAWAVLLFVGVLLSLFHPSSWAQEAQPSLEPTPTPSSSASSDPADPSPTPSTEPAPSGSATPPPAAPGVSSEASASPGSTTALGELPPICNLVPELFSCGPPPPLPNPCDQLGDILVCGPPPPPPAIQNVDCDLYPGLPGANGALWVDGSGHVLCPEPISFLDFGICLEFEIIPGSGIPATFGPGCTYNPGGPFKEQAKDGYASIPCQLYQTRYRTWVWYKHPLKYEDQHGPWTAVSCIL